jgi:hypothetical protein
MKRSLSKKISTYAESTISSSRPGSIRSTRAESTRSISSLAGSIRCRAGSIRSSIAGSISSVFGKKTTNPTEEAETTPRGQTQSQYGESRWSSEEKAMDENAFQTAQRLYEDIQAGLYLPASEVYASYRDSDDDLPMLPDSPSESEFWVWWRVRSWTRKTRTVDKIIDGKAFEYLIQWKDNGDTSFEPSWESFRAVSDSEVAAWWEVKLQRREKALEEMEEMEDKGCCPLFSHKKPYPVYQVRMTDQERAIWRQNMF